MDSLPEPKKLLPGFNKQVDELCDSACDPEGDYTGHCPPACIRACPTYCQNYIMPKPIPTIPINHHHKSSSLLIAMLSLVGASLLVICLYVAYVKIQNSRRRQRLQPRLIQTHQDNDVFFDGGEDQGGVVHVDHPIWYIRTIGLQPCVINSITVFKYKKSDVVIDGTECSVCLTEFEEDETLRLLPKCSHAFHVPCIDTWLGSHTNCPMCRAPIVASSGSGVVQTVERDSGNANPAGEGGIGSEGSDGPDRDMESARGEELETEDEIQPVRRSVSLDSSAASKIRLALSNVRPVLSESISNIRSEKVNGKSLGVDLKIVGSSSGRSLQNGTGFMRSLSLSGQKLQSMYRRSQSSVLPL